MRWHLELKRSKKTTKASVETPSSASQRSEFNLCCLPTTFEVGVGAGEGVERSTTVVVAWSGVEWSGWNGVGLAHGRQTIETSGRGQRSSSGPIALVV